MHHYREGYAEVPGGKVWFRLLSPTSPEPHRFPLVLLHGGPGFTHFYLEPFAELAHERPVLFYDQLGCGNSERPTDPALFAKLFRPERFVAELAALIEHVQFQQVHLHGHSWGAMLALDYALTFPKQMKSVTFASPALSVRRWTEDAQRLIMTLPTWAQQALQAEPGAHPEYPRAIRSYYRAFVTDFDELPPALKRAEQASGAEVYRYMWGPDEPHVLGVLKDHDRTAELKTLTCPSLFVCGRFDEATPETLQWLHTQTPNSLIAVMEHSAHHPQLKQRADYLHIHRVFFHQIESEGVARWPTRLLLKRMLHKKRYTLNG